MGFITNVKSVESAKKHYTKHKDKILAKNKQWYEDNKDKHHQLVDSWYKRNISKRREKDMRRYAQKKNAMPSWADTNSIKSIYQEAVNKNMEVDHIIPLRSKYVCGLHCEYNLQLLTKEENRLKGNRIWPDMT